MSALNFYVRGNRNADLSRIGTTLGCEVRNMVSQAAQKTFEALIHHAWLRRILRMYEIRGCPYCYCAPPAVFVV